MTDPTNSDDNWAELYRELGVEDAEPTPRAPEPPRRELVEEVVELTAAIAPDTGEEEDFSPALESEEIGVIEGEFEPIEGEGEAETEGEPDKKRRRRRRRRKKKGGPNGQPEAGEAEATAEGDTEEAAEGFESEPEEEEEEPLVAVGVEDEMSPEMTRDIIANWNVPSWQEIVAGLYRPDR